MKSHNLKNLIIGLVICLVSLLYYRFFWPNLNSFVQSVDQCNLLFCDFVKYYYPQSLVTFHSEIPAYKFFYSSFFAILLSMLSWVSFKTAMVIWLFLQILFSALLYFIPAPYFFRKSNLIGFLYLFLILISVPTLHNFKWGQISILINACMIGSWIFSSRRKSLAALLLAFAVAIKYYAILMIFYFLFKKEWKIIRETIVLIFVFLVVIPCLFLGFSNYIQYNIAFLQHIPQMRSDWLTETNSQFFGPTMNRYVSWLFQTTVRWSILKWVGYLFVLLQWIFAAVFYQKRKVIDDSYIFCLFLLSTPFLVEPSWPHYFTYLPFCQIAILTLTKKNKHGTLVKCLVGISIVLSSIISFHLITSWVQYSFFGFLFISNFLLMIAIWLEVIYGDRTQINQFKISS